MCPVAPTFVDPGAKLPNHGMSANNGTFTVPAPTTPTIWSVVRYGNTTIVPAWTSFSNCVDRVRYTGFG
jgi:hypothetical protein